MRMSADRHNATMSNFTSRIFKLDRGVMNMKFRRQNLIHAAQNGIALRRRNIFDADVAGKRMSVRANAPNVDVVNVIHPGDRLNAGNDPFYGHATGNSFQKDIESLTDNSPR